MRLDKIVVSSLNMLGTLITTLYQCILFIRHFILWNLRSFRHPRAFLFEYILNVRRPTEETVENIHVIFDLFRLYPKNQKHDSAISSTEQRISTRTLNKNLMRLLSQCPEDEDLLQVQDNDGYNLLQKAIIMDDIQLIQALLKKGCDVNHGHCSPALHLACKLGNVNAVKLLLKNKAKVDKVAGMCYPKSHSNMSQTHSKFFFIDKSTYDCEKNKKKPMLYAVDHDNVELAKIMFAHDRKQTSNQKYLLHYASNQGAFECIKFFYEQRSQDLDSVDENGMSSFMYAVPWGHKYVDFFLNKGASIFSCTPHRETLLHMFYSKCKFPEDLYETTKLLLGSGLEVTINAQDSNGNTALHNLIAMVTKYTLNDLDNGEEWDSRFRKQVLSCIHLLLQYNSDPTLINKERLSPLHVMLTVFYEKMHANSEAEESHLLHAFDLLHDILRVFLSNKMDPDIPSPGGRTPLMILLPQVLHIEYSRVRLCCESKIRCLKLLCDYGADPNFAMATEGSCVSLMSQFASQVIRIRVHTSSDMLREIKGSNAEHLNDILTLLLKSGLNPNYTSNRRRPQMEPGSGNALVEFVKLAQNVTEPKDFAHIHMWLLTMLQWGANPDIEPFPTETIICQSQSSIFLKHNCTQAVNHYMLEIQDFGSWLEGDHAEELLLLFYNSMDHLALYQCLSSTKFMSRFNPNKTPSRKFNKMIHLLNANPRSLKQISRVAILKALDRKLSTKVDKLPLPNLLKDYILELRSY